MLEPRTTPDPLVRLFHFRWSVPTLAAFDAFGGQAKFVMLQRRLEVNRGSLQRTLAALVAARLVQHNPGYGHPMRPEYLLTPAGRSVAAASAVLMAQIERLGITEIALRKWSLPVALALATSDGRFNRLQEELGTVTPRALAQALKDLRRAGLIERQLIDESPPRADYRLTEAGRRVAGMTRELARAA